MLTGKKTHTKNKVIKEKIEIMGIKKRWRDLKNNANKI